MVWLGVASRVLETSWSHCEIISGHLRAIFPHSVEFHYVKLQFLRRSKLTEKRLSENDIGVRAFSARSTHSRFFSLGTGQSAIDVRKINTEADIATITATHIVQR